MKNQLRRKILRQRKQLPAAEWEAGSRLIQERLLARPEYARAGVILTYAHFDREVKTDAVIEHALDRGKIVCVPVNNWAEMTMTPGRIHSPRDIGGRGIVPEPTVLEPFPADKIDLVIVPGVVFDAAGNRIGLGKGFFDRFLAALPERTVFIAPAFDFQVVKERLPVESWDVKVDLIITETRVLP